MLSKDIGKRDFTIIFDQTLLSNQTYFADILSVADQQKYKCIHGKLNFSKAACKSVYSQLKFGDQYEKQISYNSKCKFVTENIENELECEMIASSSDIVSLTPKLQNCHPSKKMDNSQLILRSFAEDDESCAFINDPNTYIIHDPVYLVLK